MLQDTPPSPKKILIIDDEPDICYFLSQNLSKRGFLTTIACSLEQAELQLVTEVPDILFLDNHLPDGRGVDFANRLRKDYPSMKIVMITAHDTPLDRTKAYRNGVSFFLAKPFTMVEVNGVVDLMIAEN